MPANCSSALAGIHITHVPYRGGAQAVSDLIGGQISMSIEGTNVQLPFVRSGQLRALAVTGPRRLAILPDVPTIAEAGVAGYEFIGWVGIAAPAATPQPIVDRLQREIAAVLASQQAREWFASYGLEPGEESSEAFAEHIRAEYAHFGRLIHAAGIKVGVSAAEQPRNHDRPRAALLLEAINASWTTQTIAAAVELRIPDLLADAPPRR